MAKINKAKINKVGHVVLGCRDPQASIKFYTENLGMELVQFNQEFQMAFFSFGERDHDIAVIKVPDDQPVGSAGLTHTALQIEGGKPSCASSISGSRTTGSRWTLRRTISSPKASTSSILMATGWRYSVSPWRWLRPRTISIPPMIGRS